MAIRAIAHAIQAGETSIGWAVGAESMSLKYVVHLPWTAIHVYLYDP
jgi:acetyl-CoA acetyltransferase